MRVRLSYCDDETVRDMAQQHGRLRVVDGDAAAGVA